MPEFTGRSAQVEYARLLNLPAAATLTFNQDVVHLVYDDERLALVRSARHGATCARFYTAGCEINGVTGYPAASRAIHQATEWVRHGVE